MTPDELDGVAVAPGNHKVIFENDEVRVLETTIVAGDITPLHTHLAPTVISVLSGSHFVRRDEHGGAMLDTRSDPGFVLPRVLFAAPTPPHTPETTGADDVVVVGVELEHPRGGWARPVRSGRAPPRPPRRPPRRLPPLPHGHRYPAEEERYRRLGHEGQRPRTMIVACSDSRSAPETVFDAGPGALFVVRNVAALVPVYAPDTRRHAASAALEYAVLALGVGSVVVMGHGRCGGVVAALGDPAPLTATDFVGAWVAGLRDLARELDPADAADPAGRRRTLEHRSVEQSIANLRTFPWVRLREDAGTLALHGAWFDIALGELHALGTGGWEPVEGG